MADYTTGKIYKLVCSETNKVYIGSTIGTLEHRLAKHKAPTNGCKSNDFINPTIHLIEDYSCNNKKELEIRERYYMENNICVNRNIPGRTKQEHSKQYRLDNKEKIKQYKLNNAEKLNEKRNEKFNCDCGGSYSRTNKTRHLKTNKHKKYLENNI